MQSSILLDQYGNNFTFAHAANRSNRRGTQFDTRNDDIDRLINATDRRTLCSLSNRLFTNMGVPRACILQKADYSVGEAWLPSYLGSQDSEEGKFVSNFMQSVWYPQCDTRGGIFDWWKLLELTSIGIDRDGDVFWLMVKGNDGFPRIQLIPGHRCATSGRSNYYEKAKVDKGDFMGLEIIDGIIYYASGRPAAYRFIIGKGENERTVDVPASDVIHMFDPTHTEQGRGLPAFTHALESLKMSLLSTDDERVRQQIISRLHLTIFNEGGSPDLDDPETELIGATNGNGNFSTKQFPGGVMYMPSEGGQRIEQMKHDNPGPIWESFQDRINRDAIIPVWSYSVWKSTGQGTAERGEIVKCRRFVTKRQGQLWYAATRAFAWAYSVFAEQGRLPILKAPTKWDFSKPPRLSVDDGRESKMELDEVRTGTRNISEVLEARGLNEEEFITQRARSVWMRKYKAQKVAEEMNQKFGTEITVEDREMFMLTPNEMGEPTQETSQTTKEHKEDEEFDD